MKSLLLITMLLFSANIYSKIPNDSCALEIQLGSAKYWMCDNGFFKSAYGKDRFIKTHRGEFLANLKRAINRSKPEEVDIPNRLPIVPNDSCSIRLKVSQDQYLKCDDGFYHIDKKKEVKRVSGKVWNNKINEIITNFFSDEIPQKLNRTGDPPSKKRSAVHIKASRNNDKDFKSSTQKEDPKDIQIKEK